jgi:rhodanese-related sulfurtransferase
MKQPIEFVLHHPFLFLALLGILVTLIGNELRRAMLNLKEVSPLEATQLLNHQDAVLLDVRDPQEYKDGFLPNSIRIPLGSLSEKAVQLDKHRERPIIIVCRSGNRSAQAGRMLKKMGYETVYNLGGGLHAWRTANLPISKK